MAFAVTLEDGGLIRRLSGASRILQDELDKAVRDASRDGADESRSILTAAGRVDTRALVGSVKPLPVTRGGRAVRAGWEATAPHAEVIQKGRRPGAAMPPKGVLLPWMGRHGIPPEAEFVVRRAIGRRGIPAVDYMDAAADRIRPRFRAALRAAAGRAVRRILGGR